jgi:hypothetical protein
MIASTDGISGKITKPAIPRTSEAIALPLVPWAEELTDAWKLPAACAPQFEQNVAPAASGWPQLLQ